VYRSPSSPSITAEDLANKHSKRVKFVNDQDLNRPLAFDQYPDMSTPGNEHLTSKSILEQMNQTEKRFLPDALPSPVAKRTRIMTSSPTASSSSEFSSPFRKRRSDNGFSMVEIDDDGDDDPKNKSGKFCHCNECYVEAAGVLYPNGTSHHTPVKSNQSTPVSSSPFGSAKKRVTFQNDSLMSSEISPNKSLCDKGVSTDPISDLAPVQFIR
jgi:hypothetical protein